jgi:hypothetical protein
MVGEVAIEEKVIEEFFKIYEPEKTASLGHVSFAEITPVGLMVTSRSFSWEDYEEAVNFLTGFESASQWSIGDAYNLGVQRFKRDRDPSQVFSARRVRWKTIQNYAWVCNRYIYSQRLYPPSFTHHSLIAKLKHDRRLYWLYRVLTEDLTCDELGELTAKERGVVLPGYDPVHDINVHYNKAVAAYGRLPDIPERTMFKKGLKLIETALKQIELRKKNATD